MAAVHIYLFFFVNDGHSETGSKGHKAAVQEIKGNHHLQTHLEVPGNLPASESRGKVY